MNTVWADRTGIHDDLSTPGEFAAWLHAVGIGVAAVAVSETELFQARRLRDALRRVAAFATQDTRVAAASPIDDLDLAVDAINATAELLPRARLVLLRGQFRREAADGDACAVLSAIAADAIDLLTDTKRPPLRACQAPGCVLYFVGSHPNREWCSTACGNRARAARHYRKHRAVRTGEAQTA
jgi:predicted RNA-binding Zn ribbon-like protein